MKAKIRHVDGSRDLVFEVVIDRDGYVQCPLCKERHPVEKS